MEDLLSSLQNQSNDLNNMNEPSNDSKNVNTDSDKLLKKQQISTEKLNALLEQSFSAISCGPTCEKIKKEQELKQKYLDAQTNLQTAPVQLENTKKNYYVFTEGQPYYNDMLEEELKEKAKTLTKLLSENFHEEITNANMMNSYYKTEETNSSYTKELYDVYLEKNKLILKTIKEHHGDVLTNDRKTYYETEALESLKNWYSFFWFFYYFIIIIIFTIALITKTNYHFLTRFVFCMTAIVLPYIIDPILRLIYGVFKSIWDTIPKNVYNNL